MMTTNNVQKATLAIAAAVLVITVAGYMTLALPVAAQTSTNTNNSAGGNQARLQAPGWMAGSRTANGGPFRQGGPMAFRAGPFGQSQVNVSVGQTITITSTAGKYFVFGTPKTNGTASGTLTFTVTGKLAAGYTLSVTSGSLTVAGTTYTVTSGTAQMDRSASGMVGQGSTNPTGTFLIRAGAHGSFVGSTGTVSLDLQSGSSEYLVLLAGNISG